MDNESVSDAFDFNLFLGFPIFNSYIITLIIYNLKFVGLLGHIWLIFVDEIFHKVYIFIDFINVFKYVKFHLKYENINQSYTGFLQEISFKFEWFSHSHNLLPWRQSMVGFCLV